MDTVWIVYLEVLAYIDSVPTEGKLGFINIVVSAQDAASAEAKVRAMLAEYGWEILGVEDVHVADPDHDYGGDLPGLIDDVLANPGHTRLSTLHTYKPE
jgi:hypothetical protein